MSVSGGLSGVCVGLCMRPPHARAGQWGLSKKCSFIYPRPRRLKKKNGGKKRNACNYSDINSDTPKASCSVFVEVKYPRKNCLCLEIDDEDKKRTVEGLISIPANLKHHFLCSSTFSILGKLSVFGK